MNDLIIHFSDTILFISILFFSFCTVKESLGINLKNKVSRVLNAFSEEYQKKQIVNKIIQKRNIKKKKHKGLINHLELLVEKSGVQDYLFFINSIALIVLCTVSAVLFFFLFENSFKIFSVGLIMSVPGFFIPIVFLKVLSQKREADIEKILGDYLLQLKNSTKIHNDIIEAFRSVQYNCMEPLRTYTCQFLAEINSGISVVHALENFKEKVGLKRFKLFLTNVQYCYIYGGNFAELLDHTHKLISEIQKEKRLRIRETRSARIVILLLISLDVYLYFNFIMTEPDYMNIMRNTFYGQLILNANFLSIWFLLWLSYSVKQLDY